MTGYGLVSTSQIKPICIAVCDVLGGGDEAVLLLCETAAAETKYGTMPDPTLHGAGRGLFQCDKIAFDDVQNRIKQVDVVAIRKSFDIDFPKVTWEQLNYSPLLAAIFARVHYKLRPGAIPKTVQERAEYWKCWYNTVAGKGTVAGYIDKVRHWERYF